jgi:hypothetical protein
MSWHHAIAGTKFSNSKTYLFLDTRYIPRLVSRNVYRAIGSLHLMFFKLFNKKCHTVGTSPKSKSWKEAESIPTSNTEICDCALSGLVTGTSINSGGVKLVVWPQIYPLSKMIRSCKCFPYVNKTSTLIKRYVKPPTMDILKCLIYIYNNYV